MGKHIDEAPAIQARLKKVVGQLNGIGKMIDSDSPCEDVLLQLTAANGALHKISLMVLEGHLRHCVREGIEHGNADETIESFAESLENFAKMA